MKSKLITKHIKALKERRYIQYTQTINFQFFQFF
jgi:hypothetical protein